MARVDGWIAEINALIARSHVAAVVERIVITPGGQEIVLGWEGTHSRNGVVVHRRRGPQGEATRQRLQDEMDAHRAAGIAADRHELGVVDMERTVKEWRRAFDTNRRLTLVAQVLGRPPMAGDIDPDGLMIDGRILPNTLDFRATLFELLTSREFRRRIEPIWTAFLKRGDDRLVQFAYQRLFDRAATLDEVTVLRRVGAVYGYAAFVAALLHGNEYEQRYGRGLPAGGQPVVDALTIDAEPGHDHTVRSWAR